MKKRGESFRIEIIWNGKDDDDDDDTMLIASVAIGTIR